MEPTISYIDYKSVIMIIYLKLWLLLIEVNDIDVRSITSADCKLFQMLTFESDNMNLRNLKPNATQA